MIHCGQGSGRTGSALATIHLMLLIQKKIDDGTLDSINSSKDNRIQLFKEPFQTNTTALVHEAITFVRKLKNSNMSTETAAQVRVLERVAEYLIRNKNTLP